MSSRFELDVPRTLALDADYAVENDWDAVTGITVMEDPDGEYRTGAFESEPLVPDALPAPMTGRDRDRYASEYYTEQETGR